MRQMTTEFEEELDFGMVSSGSGNLARKADIRQYPERAARSRSAHNTYSRESQHDSGMYTQMSYRQAEHGQMVRTRSQEQRTHSQMVRTRSQEQRIQSQPAGSHARQGQERQPVPAARRNPYLVNLRQGSGMGPSYDAGRASTRHQRDVDMIWGEEVRRPAPGAQTRSAAGSRTRTAGQPAGSRTRTTGQPAGSRTRTAGQPAVNQRRRLLQEKRRRAMMKKKIIMGVVEVMAVLCIAILVYQGFFKKEKSQENLPVTVPQENMGQSPIVNTPGDKIQGIDSDIFAKHPQWEENFLTPNEYSRPGDPLTQVNNIFVHYTANPNTSAKQNRSYFEQQKDTHERSVSAHFIIGYDGEIMQIVPLDEIAYAVMTRNEDSISIECCYKAENGQFTQETYDSLISLLSWLTEAYNLDAEDILRHYDCGGKKCPLYYTEHEDAWDKLIKDVKDYTL